MKKWNDMNSLGLLDDVNATEPPERAWEDLTRSATPPPGKIIQPATRPVPLRRVFSSKPTLRQMMQEYNRRTAYRQPIKTQAPESFSFQAMDLIQIPSIPGKILRPARKPDVDS